MNSDWLVFLYTAFSHIRLHSCSHLDILSLGVFLCGLHLQSGLQTLLQHRAGHRSPVFLRHRHFPLSLWLEEPGSTLKRQVQKTAGAVGRVWHQQTETVTSVQWKPKGNQKTHATHFRINVNWSFTKMFEAAHYFRSLCFSFVSISFRHLYDHWVDFFFFIKFNFS